MGRRGQKEVIVFMCSSSLAAIVTGDISFNDLRVIFGY